MYKLYADGEILVPLGTIMPLLTMRAGGPTSGDFYNVYSSPWTSSYFAKLNNVSGYNTPTITQMSNGYMKVVSDTYTTGFVMPNYVKPLIPSGDNYSSVSVTFEAKVVSGWVQFMLVGNVSAYSSNVFYSTGGAISLGIGSINRGDILTEDANNMNSVFGSAIGSRAYGTVLESTGDYSSGIYSTSTLFHQYTIKMFMSKNTTDVETIHADLLCNGRRLASFTPQKDADFGFRNGVHPCFVIQGGAKELHLREVSVLV